MTLPLAKLGVLVIKQLAKPCANGIKKAVKKSELLGKVVALPGQGYHKLEQTVRMRLLGWDKEITVKPLTQKAATDLGAELFGEFFIFGIAIATLYYESRRSTAKEQAKEAKQDKKILELKEQIDNFSKELAEQRDVNLKLTVVVNELVGGIAAAETSRNNALLDCIKQ